MESARQRGVGGSGQGRIVVAEHGARDGGRGRAGRVGSSHVGDGEVVVLVLTVAGACARRGVVGGRQGPRAHGSVAGKGEEAAVGQQRPVDVQAAEEAGERARRRRRRPGRRRRSRRRRLPL